MNKILVIDDSDSWFDAVAAECEKVGFSAVRAVHHKEALAVAQDESVSMVLVDLLVAAKAGAGFLRHLRSLPKLKNTPVILATTGTDPQKANQAVGGVSAHEVISKDRKSLETLSDRLRKLPVSA